MFNKLKKINERPQPYQFYTAQTLWNDDHISGKMLEFHLNEELEPASRNKPFIDRSVEWIASRFDLGQGVKVADFGCGPGLYSTPFALLGAAVTGIDFSRRSIDHARAVAEAGGLAIDYHLQNYLEFESDKKFDLITLIYCDFCPLSPAQRAKLLAIFNDHLAPGGRMLLDVCSTAAFAKRSEASSYGHRLMGGFWSPSDYYGFLNTFLYEEQLLVLDKYSIFEQDRQWEVYNWLQHFSRETLARELEAGGFEVEEFFSDVAGKPFCEESPELAVVARKI